MSSARRKSRSSYSFASRHKRVLQEISATSGPSDSRTLLVSSPGTAASYDSTGRPQGPLPDLPSSAHELEQQQRGPDNQQQPAHETHADHKMATFSLSWLMLTDIVGTSVLTLAEVAAQLGWAWMVSIIVCMCPIAVYSAVMMVRARSDMVRAGLEPPTSMGHAASLLFPGSRAMSIVVYVIVYGYALLGNASYLLVIGTSLQGTFFAVFADGFCLPTAVALSCLVLLPLVVGMRWLTQSVWMCLVNMLLLLAALFTVIGDLASHGRAAGVETFVSAPTLTVFTLFGATSNIVYAYTGHWMYFELMDEMKEPDEFAKTFLLNGPFMVLAYLMVASVGYFYFGACAPGNFVDVAGDSAVRTAVEAMLFVHVCVVYMLKSIVLSHFFHSVAAPARVDEKSCIAHTQYAGFGVAMLMFGFVFANSIPFFDEMLGLIGALLAGPICFLFPILFWLRARLLAQPHKSVRISRATTLTLTYEAVPGASGDTPPELAEGGQEKLPFNPLTVPRRLSKTAAAVAALEAEASTPTRVPSHASCCRSYAASLQGLPWYEVVGTHLLIAFTLMTMVVGTMSVVETIAADIGDFGAPFACHAYVESNATCNTTLPNPP